MTNCPARPTSGTARLCGSPRSFPPTDVLIGAGLINTFDELVMMPLRDLEGGIRAKITLSVAGSNSSPNLSE